MKSQPMRIAFIHNAFPLLTQTFISKEMLGLRQLGLQLQIYALFRPQPAELDRGFPEGQPIYYLFDGLKPLQLAAAHLLFLLKSPFRYLSTALYAHRHRDRSVSCRHIFKAFVSPKDAAKETRQDMRLHFMLAASPAAQMSRDRVTFINSHFADAAASFALLTARLLGLQYGVTAHAYDIFTPQANMAEKLDGARFVLTCTNFNKQTFETEFAELVVDKCRVFYHGIDTGRFQRRTRPQNSVPEILSVGRLTPKKGFPLLISACARLRDLRIDYHCTIVGDGPQRSELNELIAQNGLQPFVQLIGAVQSKETQAFYERADLFALPCMIEANGNRDGIPNVIAEAMAMELPVVSTDISGIPELVEHEATGLLVPQNDVEALTEALRRLLQDEVLRLRMGEAGRRRVLDMFDSQTCLADLYHFYRTALRAE